VSKRSKRRREPRATGGEGANAAGRAADAGEEASGSASESGKASGGRRASGEARQARGGRSPGRSGEARQARGGRSPGRSGEARQPRGDRPPGRRGAAGAAGDWGLGVQLAFLVAVFAVVVLVAELAGAANLGVALGVGQVAFAIAVIYLLVRR
jgi:hypothetical protein